MTKRKYPINEKIFDKITNKSAYWLGFLYADGACTNENKVRLWLQHKDLDVLKKFRNFLQTNDRPIKIKEREGRVYSGLEFRSWRVHNMIKKYELTVRKELRHRLHPELLQKEIRQHFIRGVFDGDGCFTVDQRGYMTAELTGYKPLLRDIKNVLVMDGVISEKKKIVKNGKTVFRIRFTPRETIALGNYIYENAFYYMKRKFDKYTSHVERLNNLAEKDKLSLMRQSRVKGHPDIRPVNQWNKAKQAEFEDRKTFDEALK